MPFFRILSFKKKFEKSNSFSNFRAKITKKDDKSYRPERRKRAAEQWLGKEFLVLTNGSVNLMMYLILWVSAVFSSVIDNIPFVATMIPLLQTVEEGVGGREAMMPVWWALSLGSCFGGNGTLIGASANVVVAGIAARNKVPLSFAKFLLWSIPVMLVSVLIAHIFLYLEFVL